MSTEFDRLPAPPALGNHTIAPRYSRSQSRSSRGSRESANSSRHSSRGRPIGDDSLEVEDQLEGIDEVDDAAGDTDQLASDDAYTSAATFDSLPSSQVPETSTQSSRSLRKRDRTHPSPSLLERPDEPSTSRRDPSISALTENDSEVEVKSPLRKRQKAITSDSSTESEPDVEVFELLGDIKAQRARATVKASSPPLPPQEAVKPSSESISEFTCPVCFCPPANATATLCGHVMCGECLFSAVRAQMQQGQLAVGRNSARCPVCRAELKGWDGRGGGVIGLYIQTISTT